MKRLLIVLALLGSVLFTAGWVPVDTEYERMYDTPKKTSEVVKVEKHEAPAPAKKAEEKPVKKDEVDYDEPSPEADAYWAEKDNLLLWHVPYDMPMSEYMEKFDEKVNRMAEEGGYDGVMFTGPGIIWDDIPEFPEESVDTTPTVEDASVAQ